MTSALAPLSPKQHEEKKEGRTGDMIDRENMMGKLAHLGLLGSTEDPDSQGHWRTNLGGGQVLVFGPHSSPPGWFWVVYEVGHSRKGKADLLPDPLARAKPGYREQRIRDRPRINRL